MRVAGVTMSSEAYTRLEPSKSLSVSHRLRRRSALKRYRDDSLLEREVASPSKYCRSEVVLATHKGQGGDSARQSRSGV